MFGRPVGQQVKPPRPCWAITGAGRSRLFNIFGLAVTSFAGPSCGPADLPLARTASHTSFSMSVLTLSA
eukprot:9161623-Alexandrium_andersonii.AAC.1